MSVPWSGCVAWQTRRAILLGGGSAHFLLLQCSSSTGVMQHLGIEQHHWLPIRGEICKGVPLCLSCRMRSITMIWGWCRRQLSLRIRRPNKVMRPARSGWGVCRGPSVRLLRGAGGMCLGDGRRKPRVSRTI